MRAICFFRWRGARRLMWFLACGAGGLKPYEKYLEEFGWTLGFNDAENLCCLARLGQEGSIQQIAGRREVDPSTRESLMQSLRSRWGKAISRKEFAASLHGVLFFPRATELGDYMTRARMATTRTRVYHVSNGDAGTSHAITGECLTTMLYESFVHQVITCGDVQKMAYQR